jgi:hypothetical protein
MIILWSYVFVDAPLCLTIRISSGNKFLSIISYLELKVSTRISLQCAVFDICN